MKNDIWGVFHDGYIKRIEGCVPGDVRLEIEIPYLRAMFKEPGERFVVELRACRQLQYTESGRGTISDLSVIESLSPEILYVNSEEPVVIDCVMGTLELQYLGLEIKLPSGVSLSYDDLEEASSRYWQEWQEKWQ